MAPSCLHLRGGQVHAVPECEQLDRPVIQCPDRIVHGAMGPTAGVGRVREGATMSLDRRLCRRHRLGDGGIAQRADAPDGIEPVGVLEDDTLGTSWGQSSRPAVRCHRIDHDRDLCWGVADVGEQATCDGDLPEATIFELTTPPPNVVAAWS